jgi:Flp pilus assembly protein TadB
MSTRRMTFWNLALVAVEAGLVAWAHAVGVAWLTVALELAGLPLAALAGLVYLVRVHVPRAQRRFERQLRAALNDHARPAAVPASPQAPVEPAVIPEAA